MPAIVHLDYLAALDSGNASVRWPQKNLDAATKFTSSYSSDIERILKLNLLWRPFVAIRHIELFDNLALMHFFVAHASDCMELVQADLIRVAAGRAASFEEIFTKWALAGGQDDPMHFHHLSPRQQSKYDSTCRAGKLKSASDIAKYLHLSERGLDLLEYFKFLDKLFPPHRILVVAPIHDLGRMWYSDRVEQKWMSYIEARNNAGVQGTSITTAIERTLEKCWRTGARRRMFYSELEANITTAKCRASQSAIEPEVLQTKVLVLNDAFYDEYEKFEVLKRKTREYPVRIVAVRDITLGRLSNTHEAEAGEEEADSLTGDFSPLDAIQLSDIVRFHTGMDVEAKEFQSSIMNLQTLYEGSIFGSIEDGKLRTAVSRHLDALFNCLLRALQSRGQQHLIREARGTVWFNYPRTIASVASGTASALFFSDLPKLMATGATIIFSGLFLLSIERKVRTDSWYELEASVRETIEAGRQAKVDAAANQSEQLRTK